MSLPPDGLAPRIVNFVQWRANLLDRLLQQVQWATDPRLEAFYEGFAALPTADAPRKRHAPASLAVHGAGLFIPLQPSIGGALLTFLSTTTVFGTSVDVTVSERALECFFPADASTAALLRT